MIIALDIGTSSTRASLFQTDGSPVDASETRVAHAAHVTPDGGVEHDPATLLDAAATCIDGVLARAPDVAAVGITTFWHGLLGFDANLRPATPIYTWADTRSVSAVDQLRARLDEAAIHRRTGCHFHTSYWPAKLRWLATTGRTAGVRRWGSIGELLAAEWFGDPATSLSMGSATGLFDQARLQWDPEMLDVARLDPRELFPLRDLDDPWTGLREPWARRWPALRRAVWIPAVGDGAASNVGSGGTSPSRIALNVGTSAAMRLVTRSNTTHPPRGLWRYRIDRELVIVGGALSEGGNVHAWCRDVLRLPDPDAVEAALAEPVAGDSPLTVLPFFAGERSPGWNGRARAAILGLTLATTSLDLLRAALEGVAVRLAMVYERLAPLATSPHAIVASGGALGQSPAWAQILADAFGQPLWVSREAEATSRGVALLAGRVLGRGLPLDAPPLPAGAGVQPNPDRHSRYRVLADRHERLYEALMER